MRLRYKLGSYRQDRWLGSLVGISGIFPMIVKLVSMRNSVEGLLTGFLHFALADGFLLRFAMGGQVGERTVS